MPEGLKFDQGKPDFSLLAPLSPAVVELVRVFELGVKKYGRDNWQKGFEDRTNRFHSASIRHAIEAQLCGPLAVDVEIMQNQGDRIYHLAQVAWNALVELNYQLQENGK